MFKKTRVTVTYFLIASPPNAILACECSIIFAFPVVPLEKNMLVGAELFDFKDLKEKIRQQNLECYMLIMFPLQYAHFQVIG